MKGALPKSPFVQSLSKDCSSFRRAFRRRAPPFGEAQDRLRQALDERNYIHVGISA
jgi:hypothetical protein